jgi:hypothetical protein
MSDSDDDPTGTLTAIYTAIQNTAKLVTYGIKVQIDVSNATAV